MTILRGSSINSVGITGEPHSKEWSWTLTSYHIKINSIWIKDIYKKLKLKNLEAVNLHDLGLCKGFPDMTPKMWTTKEKKSRWLNFTKIKNICVLKNKIKKVKSQPTEWEKLFANDLSVKGFVY